jgi:hypothetical protein
VSAVAGARVHHERRRQTQAPWSCDRTAQIFAAVQEKKKPSDMRTSLAEGIERSDTLLQRRGFESREAASGSCCPEESSRQGLSRTLGRRAIATQ